MQGDIRLYPNFAERDTIRRCPDRHRLNPDHLPIGPHKRIIPASTTQPMAGFEAPNDTRP